MVMGFAINARLLGMSKEERAVLANEIQAEDGQRFRLLRKLVARSSVDQDEINRLFDDEWETTSAAFRANWGEAGAGYELGMLTPILLKLQTDSPEWQEWKDGMDKFKADSLALYQELGFVVSFLMRFFDESDARRGARIKFSLSKKRRYKVKYRIGNMNGRLRAKIRVEGPCFRTERNDDP